MHLAVCHDLSCWLHDSDERIAELRARYGEDVEVELHEVSCLGRCDAAPAIAVDEQPASFAQAEELVEAARSGEPPPTPAMRPDRTFPNDPYAADDQRYRVLRRLLSGELTDEEVLAAVKDSGLRGMGGAGFPTGRKWELVAAQEADAASTRSATRTSPSPAPSRTVRSWPSSRISSSRASCWACSSPGCEEGWIFIRHEYGPEEARAARGARGARGRGPARGGRARHRPPAARRDLHLARAATSSARSPRCSSAWRATAASRATSRRSRACTGCGASRRS